jgi:ABC-2 type transport system permease protein
MQGVLRAAWFVASSDVRHMLRQRETLLWTFVMPPVFFFFIGTVTGGFGRGDEPPRIALAAPAEAGWLAEQVERRLQDEGFRVARVLPSPAGSAPARRRGEGGAGEASERLRLTLPAGFTDSVLAGRRVTVSLSTRAQGTDASYDEVRVARAVYAVLGDVAVTAAEGESPSPESLRRLAEAPRLLRVKIAQAGRRARVPTGFEQAIPGTMVMFTLLVLLTSGSILLVIERRQGLLRRLASTPLPRGGIVLGKWGGRMALGAIQIAFAMLAGTLFFGMRWGPDLPMLLLVLLAWGALAAALGLLLGNVARTEGQATAVGVLASNVLAALGGCWWPIEVTPRWMQSLALALPTGWAMDALHRLVSFEAGAASAAPHAAVLGLAALVTGWAAARTFRFQ